MTVKANNLVARLLDVALPGIGTLAFGRRPAGWVATLSFAIAIVVLLSSVCLAGLHPVKALGVLGVDYAALEVLLALEPRVPETPGGLGFAARGALAFFFVVAAGYALVIRPTCLPVRVNDLCAFPGVLPGEVVLVAREDPDEAPPVVGEMVAARDKRNVVVARVAAIGGETIELAGPTVVVDGAVVESAEAGAVRMLEDGDEYPDETRNLKAYREVLGGSEHLFFFSSGVKLAPSTHEVPPASVFLLCDNRSTARSTDSRSKGAFATSAILGRPGMIVWSRAPDGHVRWSRFGAVWN